MSFTPRTPSTLVLAAALAVALAGCSRNEPAGTAPAADPVAAQPAPEEAIDVLRGDAVKLPPPEQKTTPEQAQTLLQFIEDTPECQSFRAQIEPVAAGQSVAIDMGKLMDDVYRAGCQKAATGS